MTPQEFGIRLAALLNEASGMLNSHILGELRFHQVQMEAQIHYKTMAAIIDHAAFAEKLKAKPTAKPAAKPKRKAVRK